MMLAEYEYAFIVLGSLKHPPEPAVALSEVEIPAPVVSNKLLAEPLPQDSVELPVHDVG